MSHQSVTACCILRVFTIVALVTPHLAAQGQFQGKPIPNGPEIKTNGVYREGLYRYYLQLVDHYKLHTKDAEPVQEAGIKLLERVVRARCLDPLNQDFSESHQLAKEALEAGSKDLLVLQRCARLRAMDSDFDAARPMFLDCEAQLDESGYPPIVAMLNSFYLCSLARATSDNGLMETHFPTFLDRFSAWVGVESQVEENRRYVFDLAYSMTGDFVVAEHKAAIIDSLAEREVNGWTRAVLSGAVEIDLAWVYRTGGWAGDVSTEGWQAFVEHLALARQQLHRAWKAQPDYPEAAALMITLAMAGNDPASPRTWFDRSVAAEIDYPWAYYRLSSAMLPRWGGSHRAMSRFGLDCLATKRFDTVVPYQLYHQIQAVEQETGRTNKYLTSPKVYPKLREMFEGYRSAPEVPELQDLYTPRRGILSAYAAVALAVGEWNDAVSAIESLDGEVDPAVLKRVGVDSGRIAQAFAATGDAKDLVAEAETLAASNTLEALESAIEKLEAAAEKDTDERAAAYFTGRTQSLGQWLDFHRGEWAELSFDESLSGWLGYDGNWVRESDKTVLGSQQISAETGIYSSLALSTRQTLKPPYQLEVDVEQVGGGAPMGVGVTIGDAAQGSGRFCFADAGGAGIYTPTEVGMTQRMAATGMESSQSKYHFDIRVWPKSLLVLVNNDGAGSSVTGGNFNPGDRFTLTSSDAYGGSVRFSNVRVRKLAYAPLPTLVEPAKRVAEATRMIELDASDWFAWWLRGTSNLELENIDAAVTDFQEIQRLQPDHRGAMRMLGNSYAKQHNYAKAIEQFQAALQTDPDRRVLRSWAEMEMSAKDPQYRDLDSALVHANEAEVLSSESSDHWQYQLTVADVHAAMGDFTQAIKKLDLIIKQPGSQAKQQTEQKAAEFRERKGRSYKSAIASLLWEGDMTRRILGLVLGAVLLAANLIVIKKVARLGRLPGAAAGLFGVAISIGIPCALAILFGMGEGPAFIKLLAGVVGVGAVAGLVGGFFSASASSKTTATDSETVVLEITDDEPIVAELTDADVAVAEVIDAEVTDPE